MRKFLILLILIAVLSVVSSACQPAAPGETPEATRELEATEPGVTVTNVPTETIAPTATSTRSAPTPADTESIEPSPTPDIVDYERLVTQRLSPDETTAARVLTAFPTSPEGDILGGDYFVRVWAVDLGTGEVRVVEEGWQPSGLGQTAPAVLRWTEDSRSFFIGDVGVPDGCGPAFTLDVRRYDLESGQLIPLNLSNFGVLSISPSGTQALIFPGGEVQVIDLTTMAEKWVPFETPEVEYWVGGPIWSSDGERVLFSLNLNPCGPVEGRGTWLVVVDLLEASAQVIVRDDPRDLYPISWPLSGVAQVRDRDGETYWLDLSADEILDEPPGEIAAAMASLFEFFTALSEGRFAEALEYYGGSYEVLIQMNPNLDPENRAALLEAGCTTNGFVCLPVLRATLVGQPGEDNFEFLVVFDQDGDEFLLGPCCGASPEETPPQMGFSYLVQRDEAGNWRVTDLPVYVP